VAHHAASAAASSSAHSPPFALQPLLDALGKYNTHLQFPARLLPPSSARWLLPVASSPLRTAAQQKQTWAPEPRRSAECSVTPSVSEEDGYAVAAAAVARQRWWRCCHRLSACQAALLAVVHSYLLATSHARINHLLQNLMAWMVAGGIAYYLWVVPERQRDDEQRVRPGRGDGASWWLSKC